MDVSRNAAGPASAIGTILDLAEAAGQKALDEHSAKLVLRDLRIGVPEGLRIGPNEVAAIGSLRPPYVLKALAGEAIHKSDIGAVRLGLGDVAAVQAACDEIRGRMASAGVELTGFLIEEMAAPGVEIVIGGVKDPQLGPMIMLGAGGIFAEILKDVSFRLCPISGRDADEMLAELKMAPILKGARGRPAVDLACIRDALLALGGADGLFLEHCDRIREFDLNPLIARADGLVAVDSRIVLEAGTEARRLHDPASQAQFAPLFYPDTIAVVGASATGTSAGNRFIRVVKEAGFAGRILPIHPTAGEVEGLQAYPSLADTPEPVDYAYLTVPAKSATAVLEKAAGRLRFAQVMASGDHEAQGWESGLREIARKGGFRLIGPNCMGTHSPHGRYTFMEDVVTEGGSIGVACQSGGLGMDILRRGQHLGLRFSGLVTLGNSIDLGPADLLEYYLGDPRTTVVGLYIEDVKDGERFQKLVRQNKGRKPIVLLVGGVTGLGGEAAASHTGAMAGSDRAWRAFAQQSGMILTDTLDAFLDALQLCGWLQPKPGREPTVTLFGNGGGTSVMATDALDRAGFLLAAPTTEARAAYDGIKLPPGASLANPIDLPASVLKEEDGRVAARILEINRTMTAPYATIVHLNLPVIMGYRHIEGFLPNLMNSVLSGSASPDDAPHQILVLRSDRSEEADAWRRDFRKAAAERGIPSFDEIPQAVQALAQYGAYERFLSAAGHAIPTATSGGRI